MNLSIIVPIYNEEKLITQSIETLVSKLAKLFHNIEIIAIDDGSTDDTNSLLHDLAKVDKRIKIVVHKTNIGYGAALRSGIKKANFDWVFFTDADMQFDVSEIKKFLEYTNDYDFIIGYRKNRADSLRRKFISFVYNKIIQLLFHLPLRDVDCAFKLMRKSALKKINLVFDSFFVSPELMVKSLKKGFRIKELGVNHYPRLGGSSKVTFKKILQSTLDLFKLYTAYYL